MAHLVNVLLPLHNYLLTHQSFPKHFRLHTTATSLDQSEQLFMQKCDFLKFFWDNKSN